MGSIYFQRPPVFLVYEVDLKNGTRSFSIIHSIPNKCFGRTIRLSEDVELLKYRVPCMNMKAFNVQFGSSVGKIETNEEDQLVDLNANVHDESYNMSSPTKKRVIKPEVEIQRRRKIGLANKGNIPWNKGRQHSQETRERIKRKTIEALRDPKVRKKMSESPHSHSEHSKAKISVALRKIWEERLKHKKLQAKCYLTWAGVIAEAARKGGCDQQDLEWDSFEKMQSDILIQHLQWKTDKARQKKIAKRRAERSAKGKADKMDRHAQERKEDQKERKEDQKVKTKSLKGPLKQPEKKNISAISGDLRLRARLAKIHRKQQFKGRVHESEVAAEDQATAEKWDLEFIKREKIRQAVSFSDQILAIKKERVMHNAKKVPIPSSLGFLFERMNSSDLLQVR